MELASDLVPLVQLRLKGCPEETARHGLRQALSRLCRETDCWRDTVVFAVSGTTEINSEEDFAVSLPSPAYDASIWKIHYLMVETDNGAGGFNGKTKVDPSRYSLRLHDLPEVVFKTGVDVEAGDRLTLEVSLVPNEVGTALTDIPEAVSSLCGEPAVALAAYALAASPGRPWSDPAQAAMQFEEYRRAKRVMLFALGVGGAAEPARTEVPSIIEG
jgi:hypothetical protein